ncbi:MAG: protein-S-isoprenylcysteine O-methyltransferase Ste14 [Phenylobacterium sp.]|jgi:protein-S-isoprenylcysteine O-methyltransferase Ste14
MNDQNSKSRMPPPLPLLIGAILGLIADWFWPWPLGPYAYVLPCGLLVLGLVIVCVKSLSRAFERHQTSPDPADETTAIADTGIFGYSRNPAYLSAALLQIAVGLLFNNVWILLTFLPAMVVIHYVVVLGEEKYLEAKFGATYLDYKSRVRRWL